MASSASWDDLKRDPATVEVWFSTKSVCEICPKPNFFGTKCFISDVLQEVIARWIWFFFKSNMTDTSLFDRPVRIFVRKIVTVVRIDRKFDCFRLGTSWHSSANWAFVSPVKSKYFSSESREGTSKFNLLTLFIRLLMLLINSVIPVLENSLLVFLWLRHCNASLVRYEHSKWDLQQRLLGSTYTPVSIKACVWALVDITTRGFWLSLSYCIQSNIYATYWLYWYST